MSATDLRIVRVELDVQSLKTYRELNAGHPNLYPVKLGLSRAADGYERIELAAYDITVGDDPMTAIILKTTLEHVRDHIGQLNGWLATAARAAQKIREAAEAEDEHLKALVVEINRALKQ
jgi:hypothetical protein